MRHDKLALARYLNELSGAVTGATVLWFIGLPLYFEFTSAAIPGWFWTGVVLGIVSSTILTMASRRTEAEAHQRA